MREKIHHRVSETVRDRHWKSVVARSGATKQSSAALDRLLDRFALLAMTAAGAKSNVVRSDPAQKRARMGARFRAPFFSSHRLTVSVVTLFLQIARTDVR